MQEMHEVVTSARPSLSARVARGVRRLYDRVAGRVKNVIAPYVTGFEEHGWSGRLFMATLGFSMAGTVGSAVGMLATAVLRFHPGALVIALAGSAVIWVVVLPLQKRFVLGIARFERWAQVLALILSGIGVVSGLAALVFRPMGARGLILTIAEAALSAQFFAYFWRSGRWHEASESAEADALESPAIAGELASGSGTGRAIAERSS